MESLESAAAITPPDPCRTPPRSTSTALTTPERQKKLSHLLGQYLDLSNASTKPWMSSMQTALDTSVEGELRIQELKNFCTHVHWTRMLNLLRTHRASLPSTLTCAVFDLTRHPPAIRPLKQFTTLLKILDAATPKLADQPPSQCLKRLLEYAFETQQPQDEMLASTTASSFSATRFHGPCLSLLNVFLQAHNPLFPTQPSLDVDEPHRATAEIDSTNDSERIYYAKVLPVLQSSGFGKSRLCVELSTIHPGMLVSVRNSMPADAVSFPPRDAHVCDYFDSSQTILTKQSSNKAHLHVLAWIALYCDTIAHYLSLLKKASNCFDDKYGCKSSNHQTCWNTVIFYLATAIHSSPSSSFVPLSHFGPSEPLCPRSKHTLEHLVLSPPTRSMPEFEKVFDVDNPIVNITAARRHAPDMPTIHFRSEMLKHISNHAQDYYDCIIKQHDALLSSPDCVITAVHTFLRPSVLALESLSPKKVRPTFPFLAFDECGSIAMLLPIIRRLWFRACPASTWILLIDTNSDLAPLSSKSAREASRRMEDGGTYQLCESFSAMPIDVNLTDHDRSNIANLATCDSSSLTLCQLNLLLPKLGRPLWNDVLYHSQGYLRPLNIITKLVSPAGWGWPHLTSVSGSPLDENNQNSLALASQRIRIQLPANSGLETFHNFVQEQISQHLRYIGYISSTSEFMVTSTPSEPPLSVAAAWQFRSGTLTPHLKWGMVIQSLVAARAPLGLDVGAQGEQGIMLLCTMAADMVARSMYQGLLNRSMTPATIPKDIHEAIVAPITVAKWIETLIGSTYIEVPWPPPSSRYADATLGQPDASFLGIVEFWLWVEHAWINFKHIVKLEKQVSQVKEINPLLLPELWLRHAAAQGPSAQPGWDLLIPIYHTPETNKPPIGEDRFDSEKLSYIAIQVKNSINVPKGTKQEPVGPRLAALSLPRQCVELFIDLRSPHQHDGHRYSQRRFTLQEQLAGDECYALGSGNLEGVVCWWKGSRPGVGLPARWCPVRRLASGGGLPG
ncbi:uncharacterized protein UTRI_10279 [Ustilago trichophora]|uniref:Uncharacterized protein n=1 Tax=Ustilago trichophora TaxID=86804 RepID=A0A5C3EJH4_9BASI|nr:uncharacterized protein UTRI_10279 [Ustilago trichophora]